LTGRSLRHITRSPDTIITTATTTGIARIVVFADPGLFARFGLPQARPAGSRRAAVPAPSAATP
jgi:hypothetical protein